MEKTCMEPYCLNSLDTKQKNMKENKTNFKSISRTIISKCVYELNFFLILGNLKE